VLAREIEGLDGDGGQGAIRIGDVAAIGRRAGITEIHGILRRYRADRVLDVDVVIVDRGGEALEEGWRQDNTHFAGGGHFRLQEGVAAYRTLALVGRAVEGAGERDACRNSGRLTKRSRGGNAATDGRARIAARIGRAAAGRGEQFRDVGSTNCAIIGGTELEIRRRRPGTAHAIGVGVAGAVVGRKAIGRLEAEILGKRHVLDEAIYGADYLVRMKTKDGSFYVSDGYGNSRVVKFSASGKYLFEWGKKGNKAGEFNLPHAIDLDDEENVYIADRENCRVQVFTPTGKFIKEWADKSFGRISSVAFNRWEKGFIAVDYATSSSDIVLGSHIILFDSSGHLITKLATKDGIGRWYHNILVDDQGYIYVTDILGNSIQKFEKISGPLLAP